MRRFTWLIRGMTVAVTAGAALYSIQASGADDAKAEAEGIIFERQQIMTQLGKDSDRLGKIVAGQLPADDLAAATRAVADGAKDSLEAFRQQVPGGHSKPEVWSNHADFIARMEKFATNAEAMAKAGEAKNMAGVLNVMVDAMPCKECHDVYREKKS